jgi:hypothetical protein
MAAAERKWHGPRDPVSDAGEEKATRMVGFVLR